MTRRRWKLGVGRLWLALVVATVASGADVRAETLAERVERMEQELREMKAELQRRDAEDAKRRDEAERKEREAATATAKVDTEKGSTLDAIRDRVKVGGYGSFRYEGSSLDDQKHTFTLRRFVLTTDANIAPRLRGYFELEFERFRELELEKATVTEDGGFGVEQTVEGTNESEIALEQAWLQYDIEDWLKFRGGAVLIPLGRFNLNHDDNVWNLPRRSLVDRGVSVLPVPSAWDELGVGFLGEVPVGRQGTLGYQGYVVNGATLDSEFEQIARTRAGDTTLVEVEAEITPANGTFGSDVKDAKAGTGRLAYSPRLGHEIAASGYYGQYTPDVLGEEDLWSLAADGRTGWGPFEFEGQYVFTHFANTRKVAQNLARRAIDKESEAEIGTLETEVEFELANLAKDKHGYWTEFRYRFWPSFLNDTFLAKRFDNPQLVAVLRGEQVWLNDQVEEVDFSNGRLTAFETQDRRVNRITTGLAYRPVPLVVFQLAYEFTNTNSGESLAGVTNFLPAQEDEDHAHIVMFGAAFGF